MSPSIARNLPSPLDAESLGQLARRRGPCLTVLLPPSHPGAPGSDRGATLHGLFRELAPESLPLRLKVEAAVLEHRQQGGGPGLAIFAGADFVEIFRVLVPSARVHLGERCFLLPLFLEANAPQDFLILGVSTKLLRLLAYDHGHCEERPLPAGTPHSLEDFRHQGPTTTHSEHDQTDRHLHHFFVRVDEALFPELGHRLLLIMGLTESVAAFRRATKHCHLFAEQIAHGMRDLPVGEITQLARQCALDRCRAEGREALRKLRSRGDRNFAIDSPEAIVFASREGRVHLLCLPESAPASEEDLWNTAAVETLTFGGEVYTVRAEDPIAALFRY